VSTHLAMGFKLYPFLHSFQSEWMLKTAAVRTVLMDRTLMIKTNIWVFFSLYLIYATISSQLFFLTSGGWIAIFYYLGFGGVFYIVSSVLLFLNATFRTARKRTKVRINADFLLRIIALQTFVVLFNYSTCGTNMCYQGFLPTLLEDTSIPILFAPSYTVVLLGLLLYMGLLSLFLLDVA